MSDGQWWTAVSVGKWLSVTDVAARKALNRLRDLGVVEMTDSRPYRYRLREGS
jgi:Mn-dependent DtxR family transcriptional regulator